MPLPGAVAADKSDSTATVGDHPTHHNALANLANALRTRTLRIIDVCDEGVNPENTDNASALATVISNATAGSLLFFSRPGQYITSGTTLNKKLGIWFCPGAELKTINGTAAHTLDVTAAGCRLWGGGVDGNSANNTSGSFWTVSIQANDFKWHDPYIHDFRNRGFYVLNSDEFWLLRPRFTGPFGTPVFADASTGGTDHHGLFVLDMDIDRASEDPATVTGYGIMVHGRNTARGDSVTSRWRNIVVRGRVRHPINPVSAQLNVELWHGVEQARLDISSYGGTMGVSLDDAKDVSGVVNIRAPKSNGLEIVNASGRIDIVGAINGADETDTRRTGAGISVSNTATTDFNLDINIDQCTTRAAKYQNADGFRLAGYHRHRIASQAAIELVSCTNWHYDGNLDGRGDGGTATAQDAIDLDKSPEGVVDGRIAHFTRYGVAGYDFSGGSAVHNTTVNATTRDVPTPYALLSASTTLGTGVRVQPNNDLAHTHSSAYTLKLGERLALVDATSGAVTITLPLAKFRDQEITVVKTDTSGNAVTVSRAGTDTIQGATTVSLATQYAKSKLLSDGSTTWYTA